MTPKQFITQVFLSEYKQIAVQFQYISFALIGLGIEFLGACLDEHEFGQPPVFRPRFPPSPLILWALNWVFPPYRWGLRREETHATSRHLRDRRDRDPQEHIAFRTRSHRLRV